MSALVGIFGLVPDTAVAHVAGNGFLSPSTTLDSLSMDAVVWWSGDMFSFSAMRATSAPKRGLVFLRAHERGDIDTAVVNGRVLRHRGELMGLDLARARRLAEAMRDHVRSAVGEEAWRNYIDPPRT